MEIHGLPPLNINVNKTSSQTKSAPKPALSDSEKKRSSRTQAEQTSRTTEVLVSMSSTVADSNGIDLSDSRLSFSVDGDTGDTVINIIDNKTGDTVRQIPPEEVLRLKKRMGEVQGLLLDKKI